MIPSIIEDCIEVYYIYPTQSGSMRGKSIITSLHDNRNIKINGYLLNLDKFIKLPIVINYEPIMYRK